MNYIKIINHFMEKCPKQKGHTSARIGVFMAIVIEINQDRWAENTEISVDKILSVAGVSKPTFTKTRDWLVAKKWIKYKPGKNAKTPPTFSLGSEVNIFTSENNCLTDTPPKKAVSGKLIEENKEKSEGNIFTSEKIPEGNIFTSGKSEGNIFTSETDGPASEGNIFTSDGYLEVETEEVSEGNIFTSEKKSEGNIFTSLNKEENIYIDSKQINKESKDSCALRVFEGEKKEDILPSKTKKEKKPRRPAKSRAKDPADYTVTTKMRDVVLGRFPTYPWSGFDGKMALAIQAQIRNEYAKSKRFGYEPSDDQILETFRAVFLNMPPFHDKNFDMKYLNTNFFRISRAVKEAAGVVDGQTRQGRVRSQHQEADDIINSYLENGKTNK